MLERAFDAADVSIRFHVGDQQHIHIRCAEVLGDDTVLIPREDFGHESAENDEERFLVAQLMQESDQGTLSTSSCLGRALLFGHSRAFEESASAPA